MDRYDEWGSLQMRKASSADYRPAECFIKADTLQDIEKDITQLQGFDENVGRFVLANVLCPHWAISQQAASFSWLPQVQCYSDTTCEVSLSNDEGTLENLIPFVLGNESHSSFRKQSVQNFGAKFQKESLTR